MRRQRSLAAEVLEQRALLSSLSYSLTTDRPVYQVGQPVQFTFRETNTGNQPVMVQVAPVDFTVSQNGNSIWQSDPGNGSRPPTTETLLPGQSVVQTAAWDGRTSYSLGATSGLATWQINNFGTFSVSNLNGPPGTSAAFQITNPITSSLTTDKQVYQPGEPIQATFTEVNTASQPITTFFSLPFAEFDAYQDGKPLWINAYPQVIKALPVVFAAGQTITTSEVLNPATGAHSGVFDNLTGTFDATYGPQGDPTEYATPFQIVDPGNGPPPPPVTSPPVTAPPVTSPPVTAPPVTSPPVASPPVTAPPVTAPPVTAPTVTSPAPPLSSSPITATLSPNHLVSRSGQPVRLLLRLKNTSGARVTVAAKPGLDGITVLHGSTVVFRSGALPRGLAAGSIKPQGTLKLTLTWSGRPNQAGLKKLSPGTYTIQVVEGGYLATATIRIH